jgi:hypothetical protein
MITHLTSKRHDSLLTACLTGKQLWLCDICQVWELPKGQHHHERTWPHQKKVLGLNVLPTRPEPTLAVGLPDDWLEPCNKVGRPRRVPLPVDPAEKRSSLEETFLAALQDGEDDEEVAPAPKRRRLAALEPDSPASMHLFMATRLLDDDLPEGTQLMREASLVAA